MKNQPPRRVISAVTYFLRRHFLLLCAMTLLVPRAGAVVIVSDDFTAANGTAVNGRLTPTGGVTWTSSIDTGTAQIQNNGVTVSTTTAGYFSVPFSVGSLASFSIQTNVWPHGNNLNLSFAATSTARQSTTDMTIWGAINAFGGWGLYKGSTLISSGSGLTLGSTSYGDASLGYDVATSTLTFTVNGVILYSGVQAISLGSITTAGISYNGISNDNTNPEVTNFSIVGVPGPTQALTMPANIGSPSGGSDSYSVGTYTITGLGTGVEFSGFLGNDRMHYVYKAVTGDIEIKAHVVSFNNTGEGHVGLAIRSGTGTGDQMGTCLFIPNHLNNGTTNPAMVNWCRGPALAGIVDPYVSYYYDNQGKGDSQHPSLTAPFWLKLVRVGNNYAGYWSPDGSDWYLLSDSSGGAFFPTGSYNVGIFVSSGSNSVSSTAVIDNVTVGTPQPKYKMSWVGSTSVGAANGSPSNQVYAMWVKPDVTGTCYTTGNWDEGGNMGNIYKDGKVVPAFFPKLNGTWEGTITGNASNLFFYNGIGGSHVVTRTDFTTQSPTNLTFFSGTPLGDVRGLAASATRIFVSDYTNSLVRIVDASTLAEISNFSLPRCGPITYDGANFWVIQSAPAQDPTRPLSWFVLGTPNPPAILCYTPAGSPTGQSITWTSPDVANPTALAYEDLTANGLSADDRLWVCDNGPHQYVRCYTNLTGTLGDGKPVAGTPFGQDGGIWAGSHPGLITDSAAGGDARFYGPVGFGTDSSGNRYVACNGGSHFVTDVRKFTSTGTLVWRQNGLVLVHEGDFDPSSDGQDIYLPEKHFTMNYANTAPGSEWSYTSFTRNLLLNANDQRNPASPSGNNQTCGVKLARIGPAPSPSPAPTPVKQLYMYTSQQGTAGLSWLYYFNGETAIPYGTNGGNGTPPNSHQIWIDKNLNGVVDITPINEISSAPAPIPGGLFQSFDVDSKGDIWMDDTTGIRRVICQGTQTLPVTGSPVVPIYDLSLGNPAGYIDYVPPAPLSTAVNVNYDATNDVFYAIGQTSDGTWKLTRCDKWEANPENRFNAVATWAVNVPTSSDITMLFPLPALVQYMGMDVAGGKIFIAEIYGPAHVYDAATGNMEFTLNPGPEISAKMGWVDMSMGINAFKRLSGEYLILQDQTGWNACDFLYRWTPAADTAASAAPTVLSATAPGLKIVLNWNGPIGMVTSYNVYRSISSGTETLYQSGITSPTFTDLNVTPSTTYYYKVTAVNAAGESVNSDEVSATPLTTQVDFVKTDTTTQGTWYTGTSTPTYVYGSDGYEICNDGLTHYPTYATYATVSAPGTTVETWVDAITHLPVDPTSDVRALKKAPPSGTRFMAYRRSTGNQIWSYNVSLTDGKWHQVALYVLDWDSARTTSHQVKVYDATTGSLLSLLDTRRLWNFSQGKYLVWNILGSVRIEISEVNPQDTAIASGLFFDPVKVPTPAIAWWKFDETGSTTTAADSSGAGHNGTRAGTAVWNASGVPGLNGCVSIPGGTTARVNLPNGLIFGHMPISISTWFKTSSATGAVIIGNANAASSPSQYNLGLYVGADGKLRGTYYTGSTSFSRVLISPASVNNGQWHHAALVADGSTQAMYLDGVLVGYATAAFSSTAMNYNTIGYSSTNYWLSVTTPTNTFNGYLDDMRIYDKALTPAEIYQMYSHP